MAIISKKKIPYPISPGLRNYLKEQERAKRIAVAIQALSVRAVADLTTAIPASLSFTRRVRVDALPNAKP